MWLNKNFNIIFNYVKLNRYSITCWTSIPCKLLGKKKKSQKIGIRGVTIVLDWWQPGTSSSKNENIVLKHNSIQDFISAIQNYQFATVKFFGTLQNSIVKIYATITLKMKKHLILAHTYIQSLLNGFSDLPMSKIGFLLLCYIPPV